MVKITGSSAVGKRILRLSGPEMVDALGRALVAAGSEMVTDAQVSITNGSKSGRIVKGKLRKQYQASAPGEPPAYDTMDLADKIEWVREEPLKVVVSSNAKYARHLEYGTSKMAARPYMEPAKVNAEKNLPKYVRAVVNEQIKKAR